MFESSFEKFRENDIPINEYPIHAKDYAEQIVFLDSTNSLSAEEKLRRIAKRIDKHIEYPSDWLSCPLCKLEPIK